jgi:ribosomal small subunit protein bTHX
MGRGDRKTAKGKRFSKSFGKTRPKKPREQSKKKGDTPSKSKDAAES